MKTNIEIEVKIHTIKEMVLAGSSLTHKTQ
jgi:hypothetical protein